MGTFYPDQKLNTLLTGRLFVKLYVTTFNNIVQILNDYTAWAYSTSPVLTSFNEDAFPEMNDIFSPFCFNPTLPNQEIPVNGSANGCIRNA